MYPTKMEANGKIYDINTDYRVALKCFEILYREDITESNKQYIIESLLLGYEIRNEDRGILSEKIAKYLRCGEEKNTDIEDIDMDYLQDEKVIRTSIRQCYHLNLNEIDYMHWWEYNELISGLTNESLLNQMRQFRNINPNEISDAKTREKCIKTQEKIALQPRFVEKRTKEQEESINKFYEEIGITRKE